MQFISGKSHLGFFSLNADEHNQYKTNREKEEEILHKVVEQLRDLLGGGLSVEEDEEDDDEEGEERQPQQLIEKEMVSHIDLEKEGIFSKLELSLVVIAWMDEAHEKLIRFLLSTQNEIETPQRYNREQRTRARGELESAFLAYKIYEVSFNLYVSKCYGYGNENSDLVARDDIEDLFELFRKLRTALALVTEIQHDSSLGYQEYISFEQQLVIYAPFWIPVLLPLFRVSRSRY